jgi:hypothetical protein
MGVTVLKVGKVLAFFGCALLLPAVASAQAAISGVVRDTSGAVLPGVTVEASSPALIEKVRVTVTDGAGLYAIENLRPGSYTVRFTLPGFAVVQRDAIQLAGTFNARINAELRVGALEETITVTGEAPVVDIQSTRQQRVLDREVLDTIPNSGLRTSLAALIPGVNFVRQDVGGAGTRAVTGGPTVHGSQGSGDTGTTLNGISISSFGVSAGTATIFMNPMAIEEVQIDTGSNSADLHAGGVRANYIPKEGGNAFSGVVFGAYAPGGLQSDNLTDELIAAGLATPNSIKANWDINPGFGGPIVRDKVWFYFAARYNVSADYVAGLFHNRNINNPDAWSYEPDTSRRVWNEQKQPDTQGRVTWQVDERNKLGFVWYDTTYCFCPTDASLARSWEAGTRAEYPLQRLIAGDWTLPATNRLLVEVRGQLYRSESNRIPWEGLNPQTIVPVQEQTTGMRFRAGDTYRTQFQRVHHWAGSVSYVTGSHALKAGFNDKFGGAHFVDYDLSPVSYRVRGGVPNRISLRALSPLAALDGWKADVDADLGLYVQDRWTMDKLTLNYGLRYDYFHNSYPEQTVGPAVLAPDRNITFPAQDGWTLHDLSPRLGVVYDVTGEGRTAIKTSLNRYLIAMGPDVDHIRLANPSRNLVLSATRTWTDRDGDFIPDCDLTAATPGRNGECGPLSNANFGTPVANVTFDEDVLTGWGARNYNWEFSAGVQQGLMPNVSLDVSYFRRWYGNFVITDDLAIGPADFDPYSITAPTHPDLPGGGGYVVDGLYNIKPEKFSVAADPLVTLSKRYGKQQLYWDGVDVVLNARPAPGMFFQGGVSTGRQVTDNCDVVGKVDNPSPLYCHQEEPLLTQVKGYGSYTIPRVDVQFSATYQSRPGPEFGAEYTATNAEVAPSLGRDLAGGERNVDVQIVKPGELYAGRLHQIDFRVSKLLSFGGARARVNFDIYNALNGSAVLGLNSAFDDWQTPNEILVARFFKFSAQFDF